MALPFKLSKDSGAVYRQMAVALRKKYPTAKPEQIQQAIFQEMGRAGFKVFNGTVYSPAELQKLAAQQRVAQTAQRSQPQHRPPIKKKTQGSGYQLTVMGKPVHW